VNDFVLCIACGSTTLACCVVHVLLILGNLLAVGGKRVISCFREGSLPCFQCSQDRKAAGFYIGTTLCNESLMQPARHELVQYCIICE
jgi:hypothetical protein